MIAPLLLTLERPERLSTHLRVAARQLAGMKNAGELAALAEDTRDALVELSMFLDGCAEIAIDQEDAAAERMGRGPRAIADVLAGVVLKVGLRRRTV